MMAFIGSLVGGILPGVSASLLDLPAESAITFALPLWLVSLAYLASMLVLMRTSPTGESEAEMELAVESGASTNPARGASSDPMPWALLAVVALIMALRFGGRGTIITFSNVYLDDALGVPAALIGALAATAQLVAVPAALAAPLFVARFGSVRTIFWGGLGIALGSLPLALIPTWPAAGVGLVTSATFFSITIGPLRLFNQEIVTPRWRATMASAFMMGAGLAFAISSLIGGYLIATFGYQTLFLIGISLSFLAALLFWAYFRRPRGEMARQGLALQDHD
jgi:predicted MFS family arabinose efflux permease